MITRTLGRGDLFNYLGGSVNSNGKKREAAAQALRGSREKAADLLAAMAPFDLRDAKRRRWFYQRACLHIVHNFAESRDVVEPLILPIVRGTEDLLLAGMRRDALCFASFYHPQECHPHPHIGLIKFVLPYGGAYRPNLHLPDESELLERYTHLCNLKFGLEDPCDPKHARLIRPARGSFKDELAACFKKIEMFAREQLKNDRLTGSAFPLQLPSIDVQPLAAYPKDCTHPIYFPAAHRFGLEKLIICRDALVVLTPDNHQLALRGMLVRPDFTAAIWNEEIDQRRRFMANLRQHPLEYYAKFLALIALRTCRQRKAYPQAGWVGNEVGVSDFGWLQPAAPKIVISPQSGRGPMTQQPGRPSQQGQQGKQGQPGHPDISEDVAAPGP